MAGSKPDIKLKQKPSSVAGEFICGDCSHEFKGAGCPECGNKKNNIRLSKDGIPMADHKGILGDVDELKPYSDVGQEVLSLSQQSEIVATEEFRENMQQSKVINSEIKRLEKEKVLLQKRHELEMAREGWGEAYPPRGEGREAIITNPGAQSEQPLFGSQSPQAQFMSQLMRMDHDNRADFIEQLSDADPQALHTLSGMFSQPQPQQNSMYGQMQGPMGFPPQYPPPPRENPSDNVSMMKEMFSLMKEMQPSQDNSVAEVIRDLKDELKSLHSRIDTVSSPQSPSNHGMDPILQHIQQLEKRFDATQHAPSFGDQAKSLKETINDLESIGLINNNAGESSVDERIRMKELEHQIDMEKKQFDLNQQTAQLDSQKQDIRETLAKNLFTKGFTQHEDPVPTSPPSPPQTQPLIHTPFVPQILKVPPIPQSIQVDEFESDAGIVKEIRSRPIEDTEKGDE